jgi:acyl dehydratase
MQVGSVVKTGWSAFSKEDIIRFAQDYDPQYMHLDEAKASAGLFGGIIASGLQTLCIACRMWVDERVMGDDIIGGLGFDNVRFHRPVRPGDEICALVTIAEKRPHPRNSDTGIVSFHLKVINQHEEDVLQATLIGLFKRGASAGGSSGVESGT